MEKFYNQKGFSTMKAIDRIAYRNAIRIQEMNIELIDYKLTEAFDDLFKITQNWMLKRLLLLDDAKELFTKVRDEFIKRRDNNEAYVYYLVSPFGYVLQQRISILLTWMILKMARKEMAKLK